MYGNYVSVSVLLWKPCRTTSSVLGATNVTVKRLSLTVICDVYMTVDEQTDDDDGDDDGGGEVNVVVRVFVCLDDTEATDD